MPVLQISHGESLEAGAEPASALRQPGGVAMARHSPADDWCCHGDRGGVDRCIGAPLQDRRSWYVSLSPSLFNSTETGFKYLMK